MLILLPPSERKQRGAHEAPVSLETLSFSECLTPTRKSIITNENPDLLRAPTSPAIEIYSGVLFKSLDFEALSPAEKQRAKDRILIFSALFGVLRPMDRIPSYSSKMRSSDWKKPLATALADLGNQLIVDCRSSTYAATWKSTSLNTVYIRVFHQKLGQRTVVTHMSKKYRGELTRALVKNKKLENPEELLLLASRYFEVELHAPIKRNPWILDLIVQN